MPDVVLVRKSYEVVPDVVLVRKSYEVKCLRSGACIENSRLNNEPSGKAYVIRICA